jgi:hypothetical protein
VTYLLIRAGRAVCATLFLALLGTSIPAIAADPTVQIDTELVLASNRDSTIDPPELVSMKDQFSQKGFAFTSFRRLSSEKLTLHKGRAVEVKLPNQRTATIRLNDVRRGTGFVEVILSQLPSNVVISSTVLTLGREGSLFQHVGDYEGGQLILRISPADSVKPRRAVLPTSWRPEPALPRAELQSCPEMTCCP